MKSGRFNTKRASKVSLDKKNLSKRIARLRKQQRKLLEATKIDANRLNIGFDV